MPGHKKRKPNPNAAPPARGEVAYKNKDVVARIAARIAQGVPFGPAGMCEGLSRDTIHMWVHREKKLVADGRVNKALTAAVTAIMIARGEAESRASSQALIDPRNAPEFWLERQMRNEFGRTQVVQVEGLSPDQAVSMALAALMAGGE